MLELPLTFLYVFVGEPVSLAIKALNQKPKQKPCRVVVDKRMAPMFGKVLLRVASFSCAVDGEDIV